MKPLPWSFSALSDFKNCAYQYHEKRVVKSVKQDETEQMLWGTRVHTAFEERQRDKTPLPNWIDQHEDFMKTLDAIPGKLDVECKIGFDLTGRPCEWGVDNIWSRNIIDWRKVDNNSATLVDYKTGRPHKKFDQLALYAIHTFMTFPQVDLVRAKFYWTQTHTTSHDAWSRLQLDELWDRFLPDLQKYRDAFKNDTWPKTQSGLCNGWCPVTSCEHWRPKRNRY